MRELLADCVHCGFCLPACPTYVLWGEEMDSPRGRIHLMGQVEDGAPLTPAVVGHFDACLGCLACVGACPSGVRYDVLIEATRARVHDTYRRPLRDRLLRSMLFAVLPYPRRLSLLRGPLRLVRSVPLPGFLGRLTALAPPVGPRERLPRLVPARGARRLRAGLLTGCAQHAFLPQVNAATARVLAAEGVEVVIPRGQGCCGALSVHNGRLGQARRLARRVLDAFDGVDVLVANAAGCGSVLKEYAGLLPDDPRAAALAGRVRDLSEVLVELGPVAPRQPVPLRVAYQDACHLAHAQGIRAQPRALLAAVPGLELVELAEPDLCCGSAGVWNVLNPKPAAELGERKARAVVASGADLLVSANPGCHLQIAAALGRIGGTIAMAHTAQVLDASIRGRPDLLTDGRATHATT